MRIVSLLPALTELVGTLGHGDELVGVSHECDRPPQVAGLPRLTRGRFPADADSATIDALVRESAGNQPLYELDTRTLMDLKPDLILTQAQCEVCAVSESAVRAASSRMPGARVESVHPTNLEGVFAMFRRVADLLGERGRAEELILAFENTSSTIRDRRRDMPRPRVVHLEWMDPFFSSGHWNPEIITLAGGEEQLGQPGQASRRIDDAALEMARPEVLILAPCGYRLERTRAELRGLRATSMGRLLAQPDLLRVAIVDGDAFFSRPGPRLLDSLRITAAILDPDRCADLAPLPSPQSGWAILSDLNSSTTPD